MLAPQESLFWQAALRSGLMDVEALTGCWDSLEPEKRDDPKHIDQRLAWQAVQSKSLTMWQVRQLLAGRTTGYAVDRYVLRDLIGQGGMGRVYLAQDTRLGRRVALKILSPERVRNPRAIARFQREARVGAQLQHENLVRIYDFGEFKGRYYLVMEYIDGKTIGTLLFEQGPMPGATAVRLIRQVALGLEHAHQKGLIHRDVNPYNILVTRDGVAKLADLGLAIDLAEADRVTRDGATVGTFDYIAPEQARHSRAADIRSDIYSLGCTLYHMLAGHVPFPSSSLPEKVLAHQTSEPTPLNRLAPDLPDGLAEIVRRMMHKSPEERYPTPLRVAQALEPYEGKGQTVAGKRERSPETAAPGLSSEGAAQPSDIKSTNTALKTMKALGGPEWNSEEATIPGSDPTPVDPTPPLLIPLTDLEETDEEVLLVPDPDLPQPLSEAQSPTSSVPAPFHPASAGLARSTVDWPAAVWLLGLVMLVVMVTVVILTLVITNRLGHTAPPSPPRVSEFRPDSDQTSRVVTIIMPN